MRKRYNTRQEEIDTLVNAIISHGAEGAYNVIKTKALFLSDSKKDVDEMLLDMSEDMLKVGRDQLEQEDNVFSTNIYYTLSFLLRKIAHEIHRMGEKKESEDSRFLRLVWVNDEPLNIM